MADNTLAFTTPQQEGTLYVVYTVKDKAGLSDTATLTVNVDDNATIEPPTAYDYRVPSSATIDKKSIDVDVFAMDRESFRQRRRTAGGRG